MEDIEVEKGYKMSRVCDRLIEVFMVEKTKPEEWRILLAFSQEWVKIRLYFFKRCKTLAAAEEDPKRKADLLKLARRMKKVLAISLLFCYPTIITDSLVLCDPLQE
jgi:hypothetical protein